MSPLAAVIFCALMTASAATDLAARRIPNWLTGGVALAALVLASPHGGAEWASRGLSFAVLGGAALALFIVRALGGGDAKLLMAGALWMPFASLSTFVVFLALAGGVQAAGALALRAVAAGGDAGPLRRRVPYGLSIAAAGIGWALVQALRP